MKRLTFPSVNYNNNLISLIDTKRLNELMKRMGFDFEIQMRLTPSELANLETIELLGISPNEPRDFYLVRINDDPHSAALLAKKFHYNSVTYGLSNVIGELQGMNFSQFVMGLPGVQAAVNAGIDELVSGI